MSLHRKRKLEDATDDYSAGIEAEMSKFETSSNKRHTIDSDEEDADEEEYNRKKYQVMDEEDIEGNDRFLHNSQLLYFSIYSWN